MIRDELKNAKLYEGFSAGVASALKYLRETDLLALKPGKYEIHGKDLIAIVEEYNSKTIEQCFWEAHRRHIDVQCVVKGAEKIGYANLAALNMIQPYNDEKDFMKLDDPNSIGEFMVIRAGSFVVLGPEDAHMPGLAVTTPAPTKKVVMKVKIA